MKIEYSAEMSRRRSAFAGQPADAEVRGLLGTYRDNGDPVALERLTVLYLPVLDALARRFSSVGEGRDELIQVAAIGLMKAVHRFDPGRGISFGAFALPTIVGELRHHVRDRAWPVRVPRRVRALAVELARPSQELQKTLARSPTTRELADAAGVTERRVVQALESRSAQQVVPLTDAVAETAADDGLEQAEDRLVVQAALRALGERERTIVRRYFFGSCSQSQIAEELGISQIQVSRILRRALEHMAERVGAGADAA